MTRRSKMWLGPLVVAAVVVTQAISPALADKHGKTRLSGKIEPSGSVRLSFWEGEWKPAEPTAYKEQRKGKFRAYKWRFDNLPLECDGRPATLAAPLQGGYKIGKKFSDPDSFGVAIKQVGALTTAVSGTLLDRRTSAEGFVRIRGKATPLKGGGTGDCDSGKLSWAAQP